MKIAVITEDGKTISQHFGRAPFYLVHTIKDGKVIQQELRDKLSHQHFGHHSHGEGDHAASHQDHAGAHQKHQSMADTIKDCKILICGGMGQGAYDSMRRLHIQPIVTDLTSIEDAVEGYLSGTLVDRIERLH